MSVDAFLEALHENPRIASFIAHERTVPGREAAHAEPREPLPDALAAALRDAGIPRLYTHQAAAVDLAREGKNVLAVTPTASGKTLVFALPVLEKALSDPGSRALFLYPTKALARDQVAGLRKLAMSTGGIRPPRFEIYDGDTPDTLRRKIRKDPPEVLVTNPDMLHMGILAHHREWESLLSRLDRVVLDELHVYRGVFGAHVHHILRRLRRLAARSGGHPRFVAASATIGNPEEFARLLVGEPFSVVDRSGAPASGRHVVFLNPVGVSPYTVAVRVVAEAARAGLRTIAFTKARRVTELLHTWLAREAPDIAGRVAPYRAGYLPEERREIEGRLFRGDLLAVLATSALELGIDVGGLDVCVLVGYPGSLTSMWQRVGRAGRSDRPALVVMIAMPDALDQYLIAHPEALFDGGFERAVLDPWNPMVAGRHLVCAAAEEPLDAGEIESAGDRARDVVRSLVDEGRLRRDAKGASWYAYRRRPHRDVNPRSAGQPYTIVESSSGRVIGTVDGVRVYHECHPGAIYLHAGQSYRVVKLDEEAHRVEAVVARVDYYTVVLGDKETEILECLERRPVGPFTAGLGRLRVTVQIREYQKRRLFGGEPISTHPVEAPPLVFETVGFWAEVPKALAGMAASREMHFMGGLHAVEHAMIALFPLLAISDRGDVGGISYTGHPQTGGPAIFLYDGMPGGAGLAEQGFRDLTRLLRSTLEMVSGCACEGGCPSCIQSPKCGNGNKPLDKEAAVFVLKTLLAEQPLEAHETADPVPDEVPRPLPKHGIRRADNVAPRAGSSRVLVLDVETQRSAEDVGGWQNIPRMGLALAVVYDVSAGCFRTYREDDVDRLLLELALADRVVGFNVDRFDLRVLQAYTDQDVSRIRTLDLLSEVRRRLGFRPSLAHLAEVNLNEKKGGDGLQSLAWWREGRVDLIEEYCRRDVDLTRRLYQLGAERGYLLYRDRESRAMRVPVTWRET